MGAPDTAATLPERIKELLGQGLTSTIVASTVGCEISYISQLMDNENFRDAVLAKRAARAEADVARDNLWNSIEEKALAKLEENIQWSQRPSELARIASMANAAKRRVGELTNGTETNAPIIQLELPAGAIVHFQVNASQQVVSVGDRSMMPMSSKNLNAMVSARRQQIENNPSEVLDVPNVARAPLSHLEKKKVKSILEQIGGLDEALAEDPPVVLTKSRL